MDIIKNKVIKEILLIVVVLLIISPTILLKPLGDLDEIWNYNFGNCVSKGLVPYKDFSMIQTPLLSFISGTILSITSNSLFTMRVLAIILSVSILFLIYKILEKLKVNNSISIFAIIGITFLYNDYFCIDYNFFSSFLVLLIIYCELVLKPYKKSSNIIIGLLAGLTFLTKQTIGGFVCLGIVLYKIIIDIYNSKKNNEKFKINNTMYRILGGAIPVLICTLYLAITGALSAFIDYAILGIKTFSNVISYDNLLQSDNILICIFTIYIPISLAIMLLYSIIKKDKNVLLILIMSLAMFVVAFPISDNIHFLIGIIPSLVGNIYLLNKLLKRIYSPKINFIKYFLEAFSFLIIIFFTGCGVYNLILNYSKDINYSTLKHFELIPISKQYEQNIKEVDDYIQNNNTKTYILNFDAATYMIPLDKYNKNYDMLMKGNFGGEGEDGLIENIKIEKDASYLILNENYNKNWQHPTKVTDFVEKNFKHKGSICDFEIYKQP